jgi:hypothetical protein
MLVITRVVEQVLTSEEGLSSKELGSHCCHGLIFYLWREETWAEIELESNLCVWKEITFIPGLTVQEESFLFTNFFLGHAVWGKDCLTYGSAHERKFCCYTRAIWKAISLYFMQLI